MYKYTGMVSHKKLRLLKTCSVCEMKFEAEDGSTQIPCHYSLTANLNGFCLGVDNPSWEISPQGAIALLAKYLIPTKRRLDEVHRLTAWNPAMQTAVGVQLQETVTAINTVKRRIKKWKRKNFEIVE